MAADGRGRELSRPAAWVLPAFFLAALGIRLLLLGSKSLWLDEALSLRIALSGQAVFWSGRVELGHPPLSFWLLEQWAQLGRSEFVLRLPSAILGSLSVLLIYVLAKDLADRAVAITAAGLTAFSPLLVWYSQELRHYALLLALGLVATIAAARLFLRPAVRWWLLLAGAMTVAVYVHYGAVLLAPVQIVLFTALLAADRTNWRRLAAWLAAFGVAAAAFVPWLQSPAARAFAGLIADTGNKFTAALDQRFNLGVNFGQIVSIAGVAGVTASVIGLALFYWLARRIHARHSAQRWRAQKWLQLVAAGLFLILLAVSVVPRGYTIKRQLVLLWPYGLLVFAWLWPWRGRFHKLLLSMLTLSLIAALVNVALIPKEQWREATYYIAEHRQANDLVLLEPSYTLAPFDYYDLGRSPREGFPAKGDAAWLDAVLKHNDRIWLIESQSVPGLSQPPQAESWLDAHGTLLDTLDLYRIQVRLYATGRAR
jgi:mannosyltransferase